MTTDRPQSTSRGELSLSDLLAIDRTTLANERTFLAYLRTALGLIALGVTCLRLLGDELLYRAVGIAFLVLGPLLLLWGIVRFVRVRRDLRQMRPGRGHR